MKQNCWSRQTYSYSGETDKYKQLLADYDKALRPTASTSHERRKVDSLQDLWAVETAQKTIA